MDAVEYRHCLPEVIQFRMWRGVHVCESLCVCSYKREGFLFPKILRVQNTNIYQVLLEEIIRIYLNCPLIYQGHSEEPMLSAK